MFIRTGYPLHLSSVILILALSFSLISCAPKQFIMDAGEVENIRPLKKIALIEVIITPPTHPSKYGDPITNAICRSRTNGIAEDLTALHKARIDAYTELVGKKLEAYSNMEVTYGKALINSEKYRHLPDKGVETFQSALNDEHFPQVIIQENSYNFFDFSKVEMPQEFFDEEHDSARNMATLCRELNVDGVVVSTITVDTFPFSPGAWCFLLGRQLNIKLHFYDSTGKKILRSEANSEHINTSPSNSEKYAHLLDLFEGELDRFVKNIFNDHSS